MDAPHVAGITKRDMTLAREIAGMFNKGKPDIDRIALYIAANAEAERIEGSSITLNVLYDSIHKPISSGRAVEILSERLGGGAHRLRTVLLSVMNNQKEGA